METVEARKHYRKESIALVNRLNRITLFLGLPLAVLMCIFLFQLSGELDWRLYGCCIAMLLLFGLGMYPMALQSGYLKRSWECTADGVLVKGSHNETIEWSAISAIQARTSIDVVAHSRIELHGKRAREFVLTILADETDPNIETFLKYAETRINTAEQYVPTKSDRAGG